MDSAIVPSGLRVFGGFALMYFSIPLSHANPWAALWTAPGILIASVLITWGAESAQFFIAQGFALAILAWMQTLPEFAVEAVLAWKQQTELLLANLTGALRLLTGLAWPMIYFTAAFFHRRRSRAPLRKIALDPHHSVEVLALIPPVLYALAIWWKAYLHIFDAAVLIAIYLAYLFVLSRLPAKEKDDAGELELVPRSIVQAPRIWRIGGIATCFLGGGVLIYFMAEPFLGSMVAVAGAIGLPTFAVIQWFAPVISEFPEFASTFYFARQEDQASVGIMNIASSNINQWTLLVAMLPIVFSMSAGKLTGFGLDADQSTELLLTIAQSIAALVILLKMEFEWWEAALMFLLFVAQFVLPRWIGAQAREVITELFLAWTGVELVRLAIARRIPPAFAGFREVWRGHVA